MMAEPCAICGTTEADTYRFCSGRKAFVCLRCEQACQHYSRKLLSNGTNCRCTLACPPQSRYRYLTMSDEVEKAKEKYKDKTKEELENGFKLLEERYKKTDEPSVRTTIRTRLAAIEELLKERKRCPQ